MSASLPEGAFLTSRPRRKPEPTNSGFHPPESKLILSICQRLRYAIADFPDYPESGPFTVIRNHVKQEVTREKFASFLEWLNPDPELVGEEYERLRFRLCIFFSHRGSNFADELADETINRVILKSSEHQIENKIAYFYGVAKNVYLESLRKERPYVDLEEVAVAAPAPEEQSFSGECLDKCLDKLPPESRELLLDYFSEAKQAKIKLHQHISASLQLTQTALRMRVMRTKQKLKICVQECMA
jgi:DNA-directed RNA polymerase specialized sigma24 family protein